MDSSEVDIPRQIHRTSSQAPVEGRPGETLQQARAVLEAIFEASTDAIFVKDLRGRYLTINSAGATMLGRSVEEVIGKDDLELFELPTGAAIMRQDQAVMESGQSLTAEEVAVAAGVTRIFQSTKKPWRGPQGKTVGLIGICRDITDQRMADERLKESEEQYRLLFDEAPIAYHEIDRAGIVQRVNRAECELLGVRAQDILGKHIWEFVAPEERAASRAAVSRKITGEERLHVFTREYLRPDGRRLLLEIHEKLIRDGRGMVRGIRSALLDVNDRSPERGSAELSSGSRKP